MRKKTPATPMPSTPTWETLEVFMRGRIQDTLQAILEEGVTGFFGRGPSVRRAVVDAAPGYRNGYGKPRRLRRPRVRSMAILEDRFESQVLPLFKRRTEEVGDLLPKLYLHGLSQGDFELALRGLLAESAPLSASSIARLKVKWQAEYEAWRTRTLADRELVYAWADGVYVKAGLEKEKACLLVVIGALADGTKEVLAVVSGYRESQPSWRDVFVQGSQGPRARGAQAHDRRRERRRVGGGRRDLAGVARAAVREPQDRERPRPAAQEAAGDGA